MENLLIIIGIVITGIFGLIGFFIQRKLERKREILNQKREIYSEFFLVLAQVSEGNREAIPHAIHVRSQIALYGSDDVAKAANNLMYTISQNELGTGKLTEKGIDLLLTMRKEIFPKSVIKKEDIQLLLNLG